MPYVQNARSEGRRLNCLYIQNDKSRALRRQAAKGSAFYFFFSDSLFLIFSLSLFQFFCPFFNSRISRFFPAISFSLSLFRSPFFQIPAFSSLYTHSLFPSLLFISPLFLPFFNLFSLIFSEIGFSNGQILSSLPAPPHPEGAAAQNGKKKAQRNCKKTPRATYFPYRQTAARKNVADGGQKRQKHAETGRQERSTAA